MKFTNLILPTALTGAACGCTKEATPEMLSPEAPTLGTRTSVGMLSFDSIEAMEQQIADLVQMQPAEQAAWYTERNFESQYSVLYRAAEEIDKATTLAEAKAIKAKYASFFLYNDNPADEEMFNPYLPNENPDYAYVCNLHSSKWENPHPTSLPTWIYTFIAAEQAKREPACCEFSYNL